jgi:hypothetical protein
LKLVQESAGNTLELIGIDNYFLNRGKGSKRLSNLEKGLINETI